ncbi:uncharacterized protein LOC109530881 isoform X3 [Hippocampus comes]|uniref:uncharacterized protein LOC109530881 isoform X3 n=1 Tax=Hippocampus comes TaxID=109280 RepID=UPI00094E7B47|nr:PREDICTED: uncharacterized protein LOC109530881 isoform X3 [Hippocampus comes]
MRLTTDQKILGPEGSSTRDHRGMLTCTCGASGAMDNASDYGSEDSITGRFLHKGPPRDVDLYLWASGAMDNASDYGSEDSRFDSWLAQPEGSSTRDHREMLTCTCGASDAMDNASDYGSEDSRFDSWLARPEGSSTRDHREMLTCTCGASDAMDNASDYGSEDSRFDSWLAREEMFFFFCTRW